MFLLGKEVGDQLIPVIDSFSLKGRIKTTNKKRYHFEYVASSAERILEQSLVKFAKDNLGYESISSYEHQFEFGYFDPWLCNQMFPDLNEPIETFFEHALKKSVEYIIMGYPITQGVLKNHFSYFANNDIVTLRRQKLSIDELRTGYVRIEYELQFARQPKTFQLVPIGWYYLEEEEEIQNLPCYLVYTNYVDPESQLVEPIWQNPVRQIIGSDLKKWFQEKNFRSVEEAFEFTQKTIHGLRGWKRQIFRQVNNIKTEISLYEFKKLLNDEP
jgi:hypothetical protein